MIMMEMSPVDAAALVRTNRDTQRKGNPMADTPQQQQVQLRIDESKMHTTYANTIRTSSTMDEVILDLGLNIPMQMPNQPPSMTFSVGSRVVMNWAGAKRLAMSSGPDDPPVRGTPTARSQLGRPQGQPPAEG